MELQADEHFWSLVAHHNPKTIPLVIQKTGLFPVRYILNDIVPASTSFIRTEVEKAAMSSFDPCHYASIEVTRSNCAYGHLMRIVDNTTIFPNLRRLKLQSVAEPDQEMDDLLQYLCLHSYVTYAECSVNSSVANTPSCHIIRAENLKDVSFQGLYIALNSPLLRNLDISYGNSSTRRPSIWALLDSLRPACRSLRRLQLRSAAVSAEACADTVTLSALQYLLVWGNAKDVIAILQALRTPVVDFVDVFANFDVDITTSAAALDTRSLAHVLRE